jgi:hypothetical protein
MVFLFSFGVPMVSLALYYIVDNETFSVLVAVLTFFFYDYFFVYIIG